MNTRQEKLLNIQFHMARVREYLRDEERALETSTGVLSRAALEQSIAGKKAALAEYRKEFNKLFA